MTAQRPTTAPRPALSEAASERPLALVGEGHPVPLIDGGARPYVNLDYAASTGPLVEVAEAVREFLPWYSSVHRGAGFKSQVATAAYEGARESVRSFFGARPDDAVLFVRNTTDATNLLASALPDGTEVVCFAVEHHANLLPWRRRGLAITALPVPVDADDALARLETALAAEAPMPRLVAVTGASNVTGELWPVGRIVETAHRAGARVLLDGAQLAAHHPIDVGALGVDYLAVSGHKMYAPFGAGALIGRADWLAARDPYLMGGGAVDLVTLDSVIWSSLPDRQEAGSPNVVGAVAMGVACETLRRGGLEAIADQEMALGRYARQRLAELPGVELYRMWAEDVPRVGIAAFNVRGYQHSQLAAILSAEYGIGVRHGCFCAHPLTLHLLGVGAPRVRELSDAITAGDKTGVPGAVRASLGLGTTRADVDALCDAIGSIVADGPRWTYRLEPETGEYVPAPETRPFPEIGFALDASARRGGGESS